MVEYMTEESKTLVEKKFYRIEFKLASSLTVGSGHTSLTDKDIIRDRRGKPFIPGSALAGIGESILKKYAPDQDAITADSNKKKQKSPWLKHYMGDVKKSTQDDPNAESIESRILFYDANVLESEAEKGRISVRDGVGLDEWKTARKTQKYDYEILEPGLVFVTLIEQNIFNNSLKDNTEKIDEPVADLIARDWKEGKVYLGAKTSRGYGAIQDVIIKTRKFDFNNKESVEAYAGFDPFDQKEWNNGDAFECNNELKNIALKKEAEEEITLNLVLSLKGPILIRKYSTQVEKGKVLPDFSQQYVLDPDNKEVQIPVIPGTTWAGAFKAHMEKLIPGSTANYFGFVDLEKKEKQKSQIRFSESMLSGSKAKQISRNAIDRFSGGTVDGALFTEKSWYEGTTTLEISFPKNANDEFKYALAASITDLSNGFMAVGGATSVGRGIFHVDKVNGDVATGGSELYTQIVNLLIEHKEKAVNDRE